MMGYEKFIGPYMFIGVFYAGYLVDYTNDKKEVVLFKILFWPLVFIITILEGGYKYFRSLF